MRYNTALQRIVNNIVHNAVNNIVYIVNHIRRVPARSHGAPWEGPRGEWGRDSGLAATQSWRLGVGDSELATRKWRLGVGDSEMATRSWRLGVGDSELVGQEPTRLLRLAKKGRRRLRP